MAKQTVFSNLAQGCGSWDGDLQKELGKKSKLLPHRSLDGESYDHLEKRVHIPIRIKSQLSQIKSILREASKRYPPHSKAAEQGLADVIKQKTEGTEYSRPLGSVKNRPRTGVIRPHKQQHRPSLGIGRPHRLHQRAKSAPLSRPTSQSQTSPKRIDTALPKTLTTRKGALMIFSSPKNVAYSVPEQRCYYVDPEAVNLDDWASDLQSFKRLTHSVMQYGSEIGDDFESLASDYDTSCFRFLRKEEDDTGVDYRIQPGGDFVFYLKDLKTKAAVRSVVSSLSYGSTPILNEEDEPDDALQRLDEDEADDVAQEEDSPAPKLESRRPSGMEHRNEAWASRADTPMNSSSAAEGSISGDMRPVPRSPTAQSVESNLMTRPDTARSTRSVTSLRSGTPLSLKDLTASLKSGGYLGRPVSAPFPPYSPHPRTASLPPEEEEEEEEMEGMVEEGARSLSSHSRQSSRPRSSRPSSRRTQGSVALPDEAIDSASVMSDGRSSRGAARSRMLSAGVRSQHGMGDDGGVEEGEDDDWMSEDLPEFGVEDLEPEAGLQPLSDDGGGEVVEGVQGDAPAGPRSQSRASSVPPRVYTPQTRSSRRSTPPPEGDEWPGLGDIGGGDGEVARSRPSSGAARTSSAKSRQSSRSRPGTSGSARTVSLGEDDIQEEEMIPSEESQEQPPQRQAQGQGDGDTLQLFGEGVGIAQESEEIVKSPSIPSRPSTSHSKTAPQPLIEDPPKPPTPQPVIITPKVPPPVVPQIPTPPSTRVKSAVGKVKVEAKAEEKKTAKVDLSGLQSMVSKKPTGSSIPKPEKRSPSPKAKKGRRGKKGGGSSPSRKFASVEFMDNPRGSAYDGPSEDEIAKMIQEELAEQLAEANINLEAEEEPKEEEKDPNDTDRLSVATDDEAIEKEIKQQSKVEKGNKKSKKQLAKEKAALKEARRQEKQRREEERKALVEKKRAAEEEKRRKEYEEQRQKMEAEEQLQDAEEEARRAEEEEEEARLMLQESRRAAREERERKRKEEMEKKKLERERQREERRKMEDAARQREREMAERLADAAERRRMREEAEWEAEEREREERERREQEEEEEQRRMEQEEERIRELERQAEQEALERLSRERREAEERRRLARGEAERQKELEEMRMKEELKRLAEEEEKERQRQILAEKKRQEELEKIRKIQAMEEEARARVQKKLESRRLWALRRRERNNEQRSHLNGMRSTQGMTRPWVFSYYVLWPRETYERRLPSKEKKRGFRPRPKPPSAPPPAGSGNAAGPVSGQVTTGS
nr:LIM domain only protein 7-like isoform X1 [Lytechinus pictus]